MNCLHDSLNPSSLVIVLKADDGGVRNSEVSVKEEEMVGEHDEQPTRDQHQIEVFFFKSHCFFPSSQCDNCQDSSILQ